MRGLELMALDDPGFWEGYGYNNAEFLSAAVGGFIFANSASIAKL